jgi:hypothetical protein
MVKAVMLFPFAALLMATAIAQGEAPERSGERAAVPVVSTDDVRSDSAQRTQLRIYTINRDRLDDFVDAWRKGVVPLRQKFGFKVEGAWVIRERNEFVWLMSYEGPDDWETAESAYYASAQRAAVEPDPAQYIAQPEGWFIEPVLTASPIPFRTRK